MRCPDKRAGGVGAAARCDCLRRLCPAAVLVDACPGPGSAERDAMLSVCQLLRIVKRLESQLEERFDHCDRTREALEAERAPAPTERPVRRSLVSPPGSDPAHQPQPTPSATDRRPVGANGERAGGAPADGEDPTLTVSERILSHLRRELTAGLRTT